MFNFLKKKPEFLEVYAPLTGELLPLSASPDPAFGEGMMGEGLCINPTEDTVAAPFDCAIDIFHTLHAVGCRNNLVEMIVHIGMNTVSLNGDGFKALVPLQGDVVAKTPLIKFDSNFLKNKVETLITPIIIVDKPEKATIEYIKTSGHVTAGELIFKIIF
ncbi:MAG: PTS sugar transporter subunit IIA [Brevinema sp.]